MSRNEPGCVTPAVVTIPSATTAARKSALSDVDSGKEPLIRFVAPAEENPEDFKKPSTDPMAELGHFGGQFTYSN